MTFFIIFFSVNLNYYVKGGGGEGIYFVPKDVMEMSFPR